MPTATATARRITTATPGEDGVQQHPPLGGGGGGDGAHGRHPGEVSLSDLSLARMPTARDGAVVDWGAEVTAAWGGPRGCSEARGLELWDRFVDVTSGGGLGRYEAKRWGKGEVRSRERLVL